MSNMAKYLLITKKSPIIELLWFSNRYSKPSLPNQPTLRTDSDVEKLQVDANAGKFRQVTGV